jgi:GTP-binding protein
MSQRLKKMNPDMRLLQFLDKLNIGYLNKREQRVRVAKRLNPTKTRAERIQTKTDSKYSSSDKKEASKKDKKEVPKKEPKVFPFKKPGWILSNTSIWTKAEADKVIDAPYAAVIGRSNVGKSTLINSLVNYDFSYIQRAKVSSKPGETKDLTFYGLGKLKEEDTKDSSPKIIPALVVADLPGYGFAYMNDEERQRCEDLTYNYFLHGQFDPNYPRPLKRILLLLDARHGMKATDKQFLQDLSAKVESYHKLMKAELDKNALKKLSWKIQLVLTKCDLVERMDLCRRMMILKEDYADLVPAKLQSDLPIVPVSGREGSGINALQHELAALVPPLIREEFEIIKKVESEEASKTIKRDDSKSHDGKRPFAKYDKFREDKSEVDKKESFARGKAAKFSKQKPVYFDKDNEDKAFAKNDRFREDKSKVDKKESFARGKAAMDTKFSKQKPVYFDKDNDEKFSPSTKKLKRLEPSPSITKPLSKSAIEGRWDPKYQTMVFADEDEIGSFISGKPKQELHGSKRAFRSQDKSAQDEMPFGNRKTVKASSAYKGVKSLVREVKSPKKVAHFNETDDDDDDDDDIVEGWDDFDDDGEERKSSHKGRKPSSRSALLKKDRKPKAFSNEETPSDEAPVSRRQSSMDEYARTLFETSSENTTENSVSRGRTERRLLGEKKRVTRGRKTYSDSVETIDK